MSEVTESDAAQMGSESEVRRAVTFPRTEAPPGRVFDMLLVGSVITVTGLALRLFIPGLYFWGDNADSFIPLWHRFGQDLRQGQWLTMDPSGWSGGNYAAEAAYGIFNPVTLLSGVVISFLQDLSWGAALIMVEFLALLGIAVYCLAVSYGSARGPAVAVAVAVPFGGFTYFYGANNWASGLMALTWVIFFWWATHRSSQGLRGPLLPFVFGALAITTGNPYAIFGILAVLMAVGLEMLVFRQWKDFLYLFLLGLSLGAVVLLVFLPLMESSAVLGRQPIAGAENSGYLRPELGDLLAMSLPGYQPHFAAWTGIRDYVPSTYLAWFIVPFLPWLHLGIVKARWRSLVSLLVFQAGYLLLVVAPSDLWLFRWPLRTIEYLYVGVAVLFALTISGGLATSHRRVRIAATSVILAFGLYYSWAETPEHLSFHLLVSSVLVALTGLGLVAYWKLGLRGLMSVLLLGTLVISAIAAPRYFWGNQKLGLAVDIKQAHDLTSVEDKSAALHGNVLIQSTLKAENSEDAIASGEIISANIAAAARVNSLGRYTGIGFAAFNGSLCLDYRGSTACPVAVTALFSDVGGGFDGTMADALQVESVVVQKGYHNADFLSTIPEDWELTAEDDYRYVLHRKVQLEKHGTVSVSTNGMDISTIASGPHHEAFRSEAASDGSVLLARMAWPGYRATVDGRSVPVNLSSGGLVKLDIPAGSHSVVVDYRSPGLTRGLAAVGSAFAAVVLFQILYLLRRWPYGRRK
ncbi:hypothetical protein [Arthrobacter cavernae]|uniref:YfhO family protein n=1 Tax=Arthrobacter cavernae TaxID=2817681 RepID=A0A939HG40_9MICC|nr:hypothetical protein [Arthrobacter cavernae]MBO1266855.1 hypothetical protein [Arthrobacter cavernae]